MITAPVLITKLFLTKIREGRLSIIKPCVVYEGIRAVRGVSVRVGGCDVTSGSSHHHQIDIGTTEQLNFSNNSWHRERTI